jgi:hypothetical protein
LWSGKQRFNDVIHPDLAIVQDIAAQTRKGRVVDRANERLGRSDAAIILWRKILTRDFAPSPTRCGSSTHAECWATNDTAF